MAFVKLGFQMLSLEDSVGAFSAQKTSNLDVDPSFSSESSLSFTRCKGS
jgi:hypothetical protein